MARPPDLTPGTGMGDAYRPSIDVVDEIIAAGKAAAAARRKRRTATQPTNGVAVDPLVDGIMAFGREHPTHRGGRPATTDKRGSPTLPSSIPSFADRGQLLRALHSAEGKTNSAERRAEQAEEDAANAKAVAAGLTKGNKALLTTVDITTDERDKAKTAAQSAITARNEALGQITRLVSDKEVLEGRLTDAERRADDHRLNANLTEQNRASEQAQRLRAEGLVGELRTRLEAAEEESRQLKLAAKEKTLQQPPSRTVVTARVDTVVDDAPVEPPPPFNFSAPRIESRLDADFSPDRHRPHIDPPPRKSSIGNVLGDGASTTRVPTVQRTATAAHEERRLRELGKVGVVLQDASSDLQRLRAANGVSLRTFADRAGIPLEDLIKMERGRLHPTKDQLAGILATVRSITAGKAYDETGERIENALRGLSL